MRQAIIETGRALSRINAKIYDTERIARIIGEDGEADMAKINPEQDVPVKKIVDETGNVIEKIYNPSVGKYDVVVVTGPGYATKRQEALEAMAQLLQGNPELWKVAGDLFVKNMDWPGAQEMAKRFARTIDPAILESGDDNPALAAAQQQIQAMGQELQQLVGMLQNVQQSFEARDAKVKEFEAEIKAYQAETARISAVQAGMSEQQIQDIAMGVVAAAMQSNDLVAGDHEMRENPVIESQEAQQMMPQGENQGEMQ